MVAHPSDRRLWLTADRTRVVEDGDPAAAFLFATPGYVISGADMAALHLSVADARIVLPESAEPEPESEAPESEAPAADEPPSAGEPAPQDDSPTPQPKGAPRRSKRG